MKRFGYTLAEALIALAIVGVVAATMLPLANKFMPDTNKVLYLKTYDSLVEAVQQMATNTELYPITNGFYSYEKAPLANTMSKTIDGKTYEGDTKFGQILASMFGEENPSCSGITCSFTSKNGVDFKVDTERTQTIGSVTYKSTIEIDVNGEKGKNQLFSDVCSEPDRFIFEVAASGKVIASDVKGQEYLATRTNSRKTSKDASEDIRKKLNIEKEVSLSEEDLKTTLALLQWKYYTGLLKETPLILDDPEEEESDDAGTDFELIDLGEKHFKTCVECGTSYIASATCSCPVCGHPIICTATKE